MVWLSMPKCFSRSWSSRITSVKVRWSVPIKPWTAWVPVRMFSSIRAKSGPCFMVLPLKFVIEDLVFIKADFCQHINTGVNHPRTAAEIGLFVMAISHMASHHIGDESHFTLPVIFGVRVREGRNIAKVRVLFLQFVEELYIVEITFFHSTKEEGHLLWNFFFQNVQDHRLDGCEA